MTDAAQVYQFPAQGPHDYERVVADAGNGFIKIPDALWQKLYRTKFSGRERQIVDIIIGKTLRFNKESDWIANAQLAELSDIRESHISDIKAGLIARNIIKKDGRKIGINLVISEWLDKPKAVKTPKTGNNSSTQKRVKNYPKHENDYPKKGNKIPENGVHNRESINTLEENSICTQPAKVDKSKTRTTKPEEFKAFFEAYPDHRKGGTDHSAWGAWKSEKFSPDDAVAALDWLAAAGESDPETWGKTAHGQFCPGITRFIRNQQWKTPVPQARKHHAPSGIRPNEPDWDSTDWANDLNEGLI